MELRLPAPERDPAEIEATHLVTVKVRRDRRDLAEKVDVIARFNQP